MKTTFGARIQREASGSESGANASCPLVDPTASDFVETPVVEMLVLAAEDLPSWESECPFLRMDPQETVPDGWTEVEDLLNPGLEVGAKFLASLAPADPLLPEVDQDGDGTINALESFLCDSDCDGYSDENDTESTTPMTVIAQPKGCVPVCPQEITDPPPPDDDDDTIPNADDNCHRISNTDQLDTDGDHAGDACDEDDDGDGIDEILLIDDRSLMVVRPTAQNWNLQEVFSRRHSEENGRASASWPGDLDGDGISDLLVIDGVRGEIEILAGEADSFRPALRFQVFEKKTFFGGGRGIEPRKVIAADFDGDGSLDPAILVHDRLIIYPQGSDEGLR